MATIAPLRPNGVLSPPVILVLEPKANSQLQSPEGRQIAELADEIALFLQKELQARLEVAGVEILEARLSHLAYAPEIAQVMLRRQQAKAVIDARRQIVESAVGMVDEALKRISERQIVELDEERKASMINNLLVVLTSDQNAQPVVNTGSLYI
jgi:uncharacterized membrane protein YqjE